MPSASIERRASSSMVTPSTVRATAASISREQLVDRAPCAGGGRRRRGAPASGPATARQASPAEMAEAGPREPVAADRAAAALDEPGAPELAEDRLEELGGGAGAARDGGGGDEGALGPVDREIHEGPERVLGLPVRRHGLIHSYPI